ncbi:hypothetical protein, partial [Aliarcobacter butzleri]|uniref:hypothetical protein n=1 Tax=Aliarcobacter butzleri TaxID=28197 RepID=UPI00263F077C
KVLSKDYCSKETKNCYFIYKEEKIYFYKLFLLKFEYKKEIEKECDKHKNKDEYFLKKRVLKDVMAHLHEIRRKIQDNLDKKIK